MAAVTVFVCLAIIYTLIPVNLNRFLARPLLAERLPSTQADIAVVLGGGLRLDGSLSDVSTERVVEAVRVNKETGIALMFSGGETPTGIEAQAMSAYAKKLGYGGLEHIEASSHSTYENAYYSDQLLDENRFPNDTILLVTSPYHSRRSLSTFQRLMPERRVFAAYPDDSVVFGMHPLARWRGLYAITREYAANAWYAVRYRVTPDASPDQFVKGERLDFQMRDGVRVQADYYEGVTDKAVILVHMAGQDRATFQPFIPALQTKGWHVLNVDLRGHGQSAGNLANFTKKDFEAIPVDLIALSEWLKGKNTGMRVSVVGADLGANAALFAAALSDAFTSVVAISPAYVVREISVQGVVGRLRIPVLYIAAKDDLVSHQQTGALYEGTASRPNEKQFLEFASGGHGTELLFSTAEAPSEIVKFIDGL